ncbi:MAG TPA: DUF1801 domain-containing protein [Devosiaceae bacterium]|nr:DUF1801 domain-containing protein [Devosiaceae bacterium]
MTTSTDAEIAGLVASFKPEIGEVAAGVIAAIRDLRPDLAPRVRLGWGSVNFRHPAAGFVCGVFPMPDHVSLVFEHGRQLESPLLQGEGKQVRFIPFRPGDEIPRDELAILLAEAIALRA